MPVITVAQKAKYDAAVQPHSEYELIGSAPKMKMVVDDANGVGANMEVLKGTTVVASMQWDKVTQAFTFNLMDMTTGVFKATFSIKQDGNAYINGKEIAVVAGSSDEPLPAPVIVDSNLSRTPTFEQLADAFEKAHGNQQFPSEFWVRDTTGGSLFKVLQMDGNFYYERFSQAR